MKVGIITFHASLNYGSMLQAWAMQRFNEKAGRETIVVNYRNPIQQRIYAHPFYIKSPRDIAVICYRSLKYGTSYWKKRFRWALFNKFLHEELHTGLECSTESELKRNYGDLDALICGSDQIWNPKAIDFSPIYFGNFFPKDKIKIGYAPSLGQEPEKLDKSTFSGLIRDFEALAVREERSADFLKKSGLFADPKVVCDPTLLLDSTDYEPFVADKPIVAGRYLYYYAPTHKPSHLAVAMEEARKMGLKLVCDTGYMSLRHSKSDEIEYVEAAGPREFLNLIKNAAYISASSYHAIVFAILFNKEFTAINGDVDSRKMSLLNELGITNRNASISNHDIRPDYKSIDWDNINDRLESLRIKSSDFLNQSLNIATPRH